MLFGEVISDERIIFCVWSQRLYVGISSSVYFTQPYSSWEKDAVDRHNRLARSVELQRHRGGEAGNQRDCQTLSWMPGSRGAFQGRAGHMLYVASVKQNNRHYRLGSVLETISQNKISQLAQNMANDKINGRFMLFFN
jgi:hypothetical protein